jgi:4-hydroxy-tetrahydrodipicolinate synthase
MFGRHVLRLSGYAPALPTPFHEDDTIDTAALEHLCDRQIEEGATALVVCGTTGEAPTLDKREHELIVRTAVAVAHGRVPVIAGTGSNSTSHAIELGRIAEAAGADAVLSVVPYYNKPTQSGLQAHFCAIAAATGLPIVLYDIPGRSACGLADETVVRLAECPKFIGLKDATCDVTRVLRLRSLLGGEFRLLSGDDATAPAFIAQGGSGCISVTSNIAPGLCRAMYLAFRHGQISRAQQLAAMVVKLTAALFRESNPAPVKYALSAMKMMLPRLRLPLVEVNDETEAQIDMVLAQMREAYSDYMVDSADRRGRFARLGQAVR